MNAPCQLVIGNRNGSSWSLRAWLALRHSGLPFEEIFIPLDQPETRAALEEHSPSGLVPVLKIKGAVVWESLAIIETLNEFAPDAGLWPADPVARATARAVSAQMHAGFYRLRRDMPMDLRSDHAGQDHSEEALADANQVIRLWADCREWFGAEGPYLFGRWCAADMMFAPVVGRFRTYGVPVDAMSADYMDAVWSQPDMAAWVALAKDEPYTIQTP